MTQPAATPRRCRRCTGAEATLTIRADHVCSDCYVRFVATKMVKRLEFLNRDARDAGPPHPRPRGTKTFVVGLSLGVSSAALVALCERIIADRLARGRDAAFTLHVVHVDTDMDDAGPGESGAASRLDRWRQRFPRFTYERVPLRAVLALDVDWALLAPPPPDAAGDAAPPSLRALFDRLPSPSSRRDVLDVLVRRLLLARAAAARCDALLLGCSTTALAERTLAAAAKGRGFSLPWHIHDGVPVDAAPDSPGPSVDTALTPPDTPLYYPLRELFRNELATYARLAQPPLADLLCDSSAAGPDAPPAAAAVVSHRDLSIEDVVARYFADVEQNYPSVVANVVKTAAKLDRRHAPDTIRCGVCAMPLDDVGNQRWAGEMGELAEPTASAPPGGTRRLCYGCERSARG